MLTYPRFKDLSPSEQEQVFELLLARLGVKIEAFKFEGQYERMISLVEKDDKTGD